MILGRVVGRVWATRKHPKLQHGKLLVVEPHGWYNPQPDVGHVVAIDTVGAGVGEDVVVCLGEPARRALDDLAAPVEAAVLGIVDRADLLAVASGRRGGGDAVGAAPLRARP